MAPARSMPVAPSPPDAERLYQEGVAAINRDSFDEAIDKLARALEMRVQAHGAEVGRTQAALRQERASAHTRAHCSPTPLRACAVRAPRALLCAPPPPAKF